MPSPVPLHLHVGLPKSGTTYLQALLAENRPGLREAGHVYPFVRAEGMFHAAVELRGQHEQWGLDQDLVDGTWQRLLDRVREVGEPGIISHEILAGALAPTIERVATDTADLDLHVVVTARDLGRQVVAHWQEQVKNGHPWSFEEFRARLSGPEESVDAEDGFWRSQDLLAVLRRWGAVVPPEKVHLVVVPRRGSDPAELWRRFAGAVGLDPGVLDPAALDPAGAGRNQSLGAAEVALLRQVLLALDGRLVPPAYSRVVKRLFAQRLLAAVGSPAAVAPADLVVELDAVTRGWLPEVERAGWTVHGDLAELLGPDAEPEQTLRHPDDVTPAEVGAGVPGVLAGLLLELAEREPGPAAEPGPEQAPEVPPVRGRILRRGGRRRS